MYVRGQTNASRDVQQDDFTEEVTRVLHKSISAEISSATIASMSLGSQQSPTKKLEELEYDDRVVCVSGFPLSFDESQVLSIFGRFIPRFVRWLADGVAVVEFENWIQAAQVDSGCSQILTLYSLVLGCGSASPQSFPKRPASGDSLRHASCTYCP